MRKRKIRKLVIFLLCSIMITIFEPFGDTSTYAGVNRSISSDSSKIATVAPNGDLTFTLYYMHTLHHLEHDGRRWDCMSQAIPQAETAKKAQKQKTVYFSISFQRGVQKKMKQIERELSKLHLLYPKTSLTACVTKPV